MDTASAIITVTTSVLTTLAVHAVQAWWYRPRPIDPETYRRMGEALIRAAQGK